MEAEQVNFAVQQVFKNITINIDSKIKKNNSLAVRSHIMGFDYYNERLYFVICCSHIHTCCEDL